MNTEDRTAAPMPEKILLHIDEAAAVLSLSRSSLYDLIRKGEIPSIHYGRTHLVHVADLRDWAERKRTVEIGGLTWREQMEVARNGTAPTVRAPSTNGSRTGDGAHR